MEITIGTVLYLMIGVTGVIITDPINKSSFNALDVLLFWPFVLLYRAYTLITHDPNRNNS